MQFRPSTLEERKQFYKKEFKVKKAESWLKHNHLLALDAGTDTKIIKDKNDINLMFYLKLNELKTMINSYTPEDLYYDRNIYKDIELRLKNLNGRTFGANNFLGQELAFDIDPENIKCSCKKEYPKFCNECLRKTIQLGIKLKDELKNNFKRITLVYSGRGCHVHVFDKSAYSLTIKERKEINGRLRKFAIDPWVSEGQIRLIRLPYSLNGLVSRIVIPIQKPESFDPVTDEKTIPDFLR